MKKFSVALLLITLGLLFSASLIYAELAKEGSVEVRGAKSGTFEVLPLGEGRLQMNFDEKGVFVDAPENSPLKNTSFHAIGTLYAVKGKFIAHGATVMTRPNGDKIFGVIKTEGVLGKEVTGGAIELVGGTGECAGITGKFEPSPRPKVKTSKKGTYQSIMLGKLTWKIP